MRVGGHPFTKFVFSSTGSTEIMPYLAWISIKHVDGGPIMKLYKTHIT